MQKTDELSISQKKKDWISKRKKKIYIENAVILQWTRQNGIRQKSLLEDERCQLCLKGYWKKIKIFGMYVLRVKIHFRLNLKKNLIKWKDIQGHKEFTTKTEYNS